MPGFKDEREQLKNLENLYKEKKYAQIIEQVEKILKDYQNSFQIRFIYQKALKEIGRIRDAETILKTLLVTYPENFNLLFELGSLYFEQKRKEDALEIYNKILFLDPFNPNAKEKIKVLSQKTTEIEGKDSAIPKKIEVATSDKESLIHEKLRKNNKDKNFDAVLVKEEKSNIFPEQEDSLVDIPDLDQLATKREELLSEQKKLIQNKTEKLAGKKEDIRSLTESNILSSTNSKMLEEEDSNLKSANVSGEGKMAEERTAESTEKDLFSILEEREDILPEIFEEKAKVSEPIQLENKPNIQEEKPVFAAQVQREQGNIDIDLETPEAKKMMEDSQENFESFKDELKKFFANQDSKTAEESQGTESEAEVNKIPESEIKKSPDGMEENTAEDYAIDAIGVNPEEKDLEKSEFPNLIKTDMQLAFEEQAKLEEKFDTEKPVKAEEKTAENNLQDSLNYETSDPDLKKNFFNQLQKELLDFGISDQITAVIGSEASGTANGEKVPIEREMKEEKNITKILDAKVERNLIKEREENDLNLFAELKEPVKEEEIGFVTESSAEIYESQELFSEALAIYKKLYQEKKNNQYLKKIEVLNKKRLIQTKIMALEKLLNHIKNKGVHLV